MDKLLKQLDQFIELRDNAIDHELFGQFDGFRDLEIAPPIQEAQLADYSAKFRQIIAFRPETQAPLLCMEMPQETNAQYVILPDKIDHRVREIENADAVLAEPPIYSNEQFKGLAEEVNGPKYVDLLAKWIVSRSPATRGYGTHQLHLEREIADIIHSAGKDSQEPSGDDNIIRAIYSLLYKREYPSKPQRYSLPNSQKRVNDRIRELRGLLDPMGSECRPRSALDIGCAEGAFIAGLEQYFGLERAVGMDVRAPDSQYSIEFVESSALELQEQFRGQFDLIVISMTLHHIPCYKTVLANAVQYLKPGGLLFIREHDAACNAHKLMLDLHDQCFNGCLWETPESSIEAFETHARSWFISQQNVRMALREIRGVEEISFSKIIGRMQEWEMYGRVWYGLWRSH